MTKQNRAPQSHRAIYALMPTPEQAKALTLTLEQFNRAAQFVVDVACSNRVFNKYDLQRMTYKTLRADYSLMAQMAIQAISKAVDACCDVPGLRDAAPPSPPQIEPHSPMVYDDRIMSFKGYATVSLRCLTTRELVPLEFMLMDVRPHPERSLGQAELVAHDGEFFLALSVDASHRTPAREREIAAMTARRFGSMQIGLGMETPVRWYLRTLMELDFLDAGFLIDPMSSAHSPAIAVVEPTGTGALV